MKAISLKQPWAYLLCAGIKNIENHTWKLPEKYKGERVLIHASAQMAKSYSFTDEQQESASLGRNSIKRRIYCERFRSAIIGSVRFVDCVINHPSIWAEKTEVYNAWCKQNGCENYIEWSPGYGDCVSCKLIGQSYNIDKIADKCPFKKDANKPIYNWVATDAVLFENPILNVKGKLGFWDYPMIEEEYNNLAKI